MVTLGGVDRDRVLGKALGAGMSYVWIWGVVTQYIHM